MAFGEFIASRMEAGRRKHKRDKINAMIADSYVEGETTPYVDEEANFMAESLSPAEHEQIDYQGSAPGLVESQGPGYIDMPGVVNRMAQGGFGMEAIALQDSMNKAGPDLSNETRTYNAFRDLPGGQDEQDAYLRWKRAQPTTDLGGRVVAPRPTDPTKVDVVGVKTLPPKEQLPYLGRKEKQKQKIASAVKKAAAKPKATLAMGQAEQRTNRLKTAIAKAKEQASAWTTGPAATTSSIPGTPAYDLSQTLQTVKANIGFDALNAMRQSSPTGGALGQVSERELGYLQSVLSSLEQAQSPSQLQENLSIAETQIEESWKRIADAYQQDYGEPMQEQEKQVKFTTYATKGDQTIGSNDGSTWFDVKTGKRVR